MAITPKPKLSEHIDILIILVYNSLCFSDSWLFCSCGLINPCKHITCFYFNALSEVVTTGDNLITVDFS